MPEETSFLYGQTIQQGRPLHCAAWAIGDLLVVAGVIRDAQFAHARTQVGLQKSAPLLADHHTGTRLEQRLPVVEIGLRHIGHRAQCPHAR